MGQLQRVGAELYGIDGDVGSFLCHKQLLLSNLNGNGDGESEIDRPEPTRRIR